MIISIPERDWDQIVSDLENMCGVDASEIEVLQEVEILNPWVYQRHSPPQFLSDRIRLALRKIDAM